MALGDYEKTVYKNGEAPGLSANNLNKNEDKTKELDTEIAQHLADNTTETQKGHVELATAAETTAGTDNTRAVHPAGLKVELDKKIANSLLSAAGDIIYASAANTPAILAKGTNGQFLGLTNGLPAWFTPNIFAPSGLTGATAASRYVGATASGAPTTGTFVIGDFVIDRTGQFWVCTVAGTPGTWVSPGAKFKMGNYTGNNTASRFITVGFTPSFVLVIAADGTGTYTGPGNFFIVSATGGIGLYNPSGVKIYFDSPTPNDVAGKLGTNGFYTGTEINNLNQNGITFYWWAYA